MLIEGRHHRTIWPLGEGGQGPVRIIDQTRLPHDLAFVDLEGLEDAAVAIETMQVRGAPLIGATAAYGVALAMRADEQKCLDAGADAYLAKPVSPERLVDLLAKAADSR